MKLTSCLAEERGNRGSCASKKRTRSNGCRPSFSSPRRDYHLGCLLTQPRSNKSAGKFAAERPCKTRGGQIYRRNDDETVDALQNQEGCLPVPERGIAITTRTDENRREPTRTTWTDGITRRTAAGRWKRPSYRRKFLRYSNN